MWALFHFVELRGFEPLTPSMRTRCATELRHSPLRADPRIPGELVVDSATVPVTVIVGRIGAGNVDEFIEPKLEFSVGSGGAKRLCLLQHALARPVTVRRRIEIARHPSCTGAVEVAG